jgi:HlyD family secretion protein
MRGMVLGGLLLVAVVGGLTAANLRRDSSATPLDWRILKPPPREVEIEQPREDGIVETITASGTVEPVEEAEIAPQIVGRVTEVLVEDGDRVKTGDVLLRLDQTSAMARLTSADARISRLDAAITSAKTSLEKAQRDLLRTERLTSRNVSTPTELLDMRTEYEVANATLNMAQRDLAESQAMKITAAQDLSYTTITAPIDGVVSACKVEVGEVVIAGTTNLPGSILMTVADLSRMRVRADVDETDVPLVEPGQPARIFLQADLLTAIPGKVDRVAPKGVLNKEVVTFETMIDVDSPSGTALRSGMTATIEIEVRRTNGAISVPVQAVVHRRKKDLPDTKEVRDWVAKAPLAPGEQAEEAEARYVRIVFVEAGGLARARPVEIGLSDERRIEILSGIEPNDRVIVGPFRALDELKDGDPVQKAKPKAAEEGAGA